MTEAFGPFCRNHKVPALANPTPNSSVFYEDPSAAKSAIIERIVSNDRLNFQQWIRAAGGRLPTLDVPSAALRFGLIPRRLFELVQNPGTVDIEVDPDSTSSLNWIDVSVLTRWPKVEVLYELFLTTRETSSGGRILWVANYVDCVPLRHQHLSFAIFQKLHWLAGALRFDFILGSHNPSNSWFFTGAWGGTRLSDFPEAERDNYFPGWRRFDPEFMAIKSVRQIPE